MTYTAQVTAIAAKLATVDDVGIVHTRPRFGDALTHWVTEIEGIPTIRAWEIGLDVEGIRVERTTQAHRHKWTTFLIRGYMSLGEPEIDDDTGEEVPTIGGYNTLVDFASAIGDALDVDPTVGGTMLDHNATQIGEPTPLVIGGGPICWGITLSLTGYVVARYT